MHELIITYDIKPLFGRRREKTVALRMPESWDELTQKDLLLIANLQSFDDVDIKKTLLFAQLSRIPKSVFVRLNEYQIMSCYDVVDVFLNTPNLTVNLFPIVKTGGKKLYGPGDCFQFVTLDEFMEADDHYFEWMTLMNDEDRDVKKCVSSLEKLLATMWRPRKKTTTLGDDPRQAFNANTVAYTADLLKKLPFNQKMAMYYYFIGCRETLRTVLKHLFKVDPAPQPDREAWLKMIAHLPSEKYGTMDQIGNKDLWTVLYYADYFIAQNKKENSAT